MEYTPQELALAVRKLIENHPENWQQAVWYGYESHDLDVADIRRSMESGECGTIACVAGWAAILMSPEGTRLRENPLASNLDSVQYPNGGGASIRNIAEAALGLTDDEADYLFEPQRTKEEVIAILTAIENGFDWYRDLP